MAGVICEGTMVIPGCLEDSPETFASMVVQALQMGLINTVVPLERLEEETLVWCREILRNSHTALRVLKAALNAAVCALHLSRSRQTAAMLC